MKAIIIILIWLIIGFLGVYATAQKFGSGGFNRLSKDRPELVIVGTVLGPLPWLSYVIFSIENSNG